MMLDTLHYKKKIEVPKTDFNFENENTKYFDVKKNV